MAPQKKREQWLVPGTSINKKTGKHNEYLVTCEINDTWKCDCGSWMFQKKETWVNGKRVDCQHILRKKLELGIGITAPKGPVTVTTRMEDEKIIRSITFEDV